MKTQVEISSPHLVDDILSGQLAATTDLVEVQVGPGPTEVRKELWGRIRRCMRHVRGLEGLRVPAHQARARSRTSQSREVDWDPPLEDARILGELERVARLPQDPMEALLVLLDKRTIRELGHRPQDFIEDIISDDLGPEDLLAATIGRSVEQTSRRAHLNARSKYNGHVFSPIRLVRNLNLVKWCGLPINWSATKTLVEFGPGKNGVSALASAKGWTTHVVEKNASLRFVSLEKGCNSVVEAELGKSDPQMIKRLIESALPDFIVGIGLLNFFTFVSTDLYRQTVAALSPESTRGSTKALWVTYDQFTAHNAEKSAIGGLAEGLHLRNTAFREAGWQRVPISTEISSRKLSVLGLNYSRGAEISIWVRGI